MGESANSVDVRPTPEFRVSFPKLFTPEGFQGGEPKYSIVMLYDKDTDLTALKKAAHTAAVEKWGADTKKWPKNMRNPFRDGAEKDNLAGYENCIFVSASSKERPGIVDQKKRPITETDGRFYPGCYARASLRAYAYDFAGNRGVAFGLNNVQLVRDGAPFSGRRSATDDFDEIDCVSDDGSDDQDNYSFD